MRSIILSLNATVPLLAANAIVIFVKVLFG
jgi:hypothetical protein